MRPLLLCGVVLVLMGCQKQEVPVIDTKPLEDRLTKAENRVSILEAQIAQLQTQAVKKPVSSETWVLWTRLDYRPGQFGVGPVPFKPISAFETRSDCMDGARGQVEAGGTNVTKDPLVIDYPNGRREFACLPKGVDAGYHYNK